MRRSVRSARRPVSLLGVISLGIVLAVALLAGFWAVGWVDFPFLRRPLLISHAGMEAIPVANRTIPAFTKMTRDYLMDPKTGELSVMWIPKGKVGPEIIRDGNQILNRVLSRDKLAQYGFTNHDFLPEGTLPGLAGGTPPGKRAQTLEVEHLTGVFGLETGDHLDLLATVPIDAIPATGQIGISAKELAAQAEYAKIRKRATVRVLAEDAVIITPVHTREKPITSNGLMTGSQTRTIPVQEVVIAVEPDEVAKIGEALAMHLQITAVARSGRPTDPGPTVQTPGADPLSDAPVQIVETITGSKRDTQVFSAIPVRISPAIAAPAAVVPAKPYGAPPASATPISPRGDQATGIGDSSDVQRAGSLPRQESPFGDEDRSAAPK